MMITAAVYERDMKEHLTTINTGTKLQAEETLSETVEVLKQFGYTKGAEIFQKIVKRAVDENAISSEVSE